MNIITNRPSIRRITKNESGSIVILSLLVAVVFVSLCGSYFGLLAVESNNTEKAFRSNLALHLAESAVDVSIWEINHNAVPFSAAHGWTGTNPTTRTATLTAASGEDLGTYTAVVTNPTSDSPTVRGIGQAFYQGSKLAETRGVEVDVDVSTSPIFDMAVFADESLHIDSNSCTDSYNPDEGPYDPDNHNSNGDIGTNSTEDGAITIDAESTIEGDALVGVNGNPDDVINEKKDPITGTATALDEPVNIPSITAPLGLPYYGSVNFQEEDGAYEIASSGQYSDLIMDAAQAQLVIPDNVNIDVHVMGAFELKQTSSLIIGENSSVTFFVDGSIVFGSNAVINHSTMDPSRLRLFGTDSMTDGLDHKGEPTVPAITLNSNNGIYAVVLAPNSTVELDSNIELFGAIMSNDIIINSNTCVHYDETLIDNDDLQTTTGTISTWQEI